MTKFNTTNNNNNQKEQHFFSLALRSLLCIRFVECSLLVWRSFLKKGTPLDLFLPHPGSAPGRIWPKRQIHARVHEFFIPTKEGWNDIPLVLQYRRFDSVHGRRQPGKHPDLFERNNLVEFILRPFLSDLILLARMVWKRSTYKLNHLEYFVHSCPLHAQKLRETSWDVCASDNNNFTTIRYFSVEFPLTFITLFLEFDTGPLY